MEFKIGDRVRYHGSITGDSDGIVVGIVKELGECAWVRFYSGFRATLSQPGVAFPEDLTHIKKRCVMNV